LLRRSRLCSCVISLLRGVDPGADTRVLHMATMATAKPKEMFKYLIDHGGDINK
jgi:hypothetical protein